MFKQCAFTLVELLISLAVLMILASVASQSYNQLFTQQALVASTENLYQFLVFAKSESIKYNQKVYVHFCQNGTSNEWRMAQSDQPACDCFVANSCLLNGVQHNQQLTDGKLVFTSSSDISFTGLQASYNPMRFSVNAGSVILSDNSGNRLKVIQSAMRLRVCAPDNKQLGYEQC